MKNKVLYWGDPPSLPWTKFPGFWLNFDFIHKHGKNFDSFTNGIVKEILNYE